MKRVIKGTIAALSVTLLVLAVAELAVLPRRDAPLPRAIQLLGFHAVPGQVLDDTPISALGFAGDAIDVAKPPGTVRVLMLGASAFFNRRMALRLKSALQERTEARVEVVGAALRTHTSMASVLKYRALRQYAFDCVLVYHGINDLWANNAPPDRFRDDYSHMGGWYARGPLLDRSLIARRAYNRWFHEGVNYVFPGPVDGNACRGASYPLFRRNLETIVAEVRADGATPVLISFAWCLPPAYTREAFESGTLGYVNPEDYDRCPVQLWGSPRYVHEGLTANDASVRAVARDRAVPFLDAERLIGKDPALFGDVCHLNEVGTQKLVDAIARFLARSGLLRPAE